MTNESPFLFRVARLDDGENRFEIDVDPDDLDLAFHRFITGLHCLLVLTRTRERVDVQLEVSATIRLECSRCQELTDFDIHSSANLSYLPKDHDKDSIEDTTDLEFYTEEIDLKGVVRDCFILGLPIAPLCKKNCKGLCPTCGTNLNKASCNCGEDSATSPFEDLRRLVDGR